MTMSKETKKYIEKKGKLKQEPEPERDQRETKGQEPDEKHELQKYQIITWNNKDEEGNTNPSTYLTKNTYNPQKQEYVNFRIPLTSKADALIIQHLLKEKYQL